MGFFIVKRALILIDLQNDFMPGGSLAVPQGDEIIELANSLQSLFDVVIATQDWHPEDHGSFAAHHPGHKPGDSVGLKGISQILWPTHCVQESKGAEFAPGLEISRITKIFHKGTDPTIDSYSAFFDNAHLRSTGLAHYLKDQGVEEVYLMGVATDYCVKYTALDACHLGFKVYVIEDACRGINLKSGDIEKAFAEMQKAGAVILQSREIKKN